jgi:hypothetical protein
MNGKQLGLLLVLADFAAFEAYAVWKYGVVGLFQLVLANAATGVAFADLCIALGLIIFWMWGDARERGASVVPYVLMTLGLGSVGPLAYLIRREGQLRPVRAARLATAS